MKIKRTTEKDKVEGTGKNNENRSCYMLIYNSRRENVLFVYGLLYVNNLSTPRSNHAPTFCCVPLCSLVNETCFKTSNPNAWIICICQRSVPFTIHQCLRLGEHFILCTKHICMLAAHTKIISIVHNPEKCFQ